MGAPEFKAMKGNAVFVNIGRGDTVDQAVMIEALKASRGENEPVDAIGGLRIGSASLEYVTIRCSRVSARPDLVLPSTSQRDRSRAFT